VVKIIRSLYNYICTEPGFYFAIFIIVWMTAWVLNGLKKTEFDLTQLRDLFVFVLGKYTVDSGLNSKVGESLKKEGSCNI